jgi:hypothetical protein
MNFSESIILAWILDLYLEYSFYLLDTYLNPKRNNTRNIDLNPDTRSLR